MDLRRVVPAAAILILTLAACGGGAGASTAPDGGAPTEPATSADAGQSAAAPTDPPAAASATAAAGNGSTAGVCELVTASELEGILGLSPVETVVIPGPPDTCDIQANGAPIAAFVYTPGASPFVYDAYANDTGSTAISGLGDKAAFNPNQQLLVIAKGDSLLSIAVYDDGTTSEAERIELMKAIGAIAVGRM